MQQPQFQRARDSLCQPLQDAILETDLQIRNQPSTPALHKRHAELLTAVNTQYKERRGATQKLGSGEIDHFTILNICLRTAIAADRDVESYGLAKLTMIERPNEDNLLGRMWAATSLGLGKGVPRSKPEASAAMLGIAKLKTATPDLKAALADIAMSMYLEK